MSNPSQIPPESISHPLLYATQPVHPLHQPSTWIERVIQVHATLFTMDINGVETLVILQNQNFLAQLISKGMKKAIEYFVNQIRLSNVMNSLVKSTTPQFIQTMQSFWNLQHLLNQFPNMNEIAQTPFFTPQEVVNAYPLFFPWTPFFLQQGQFVNLETPSAAVPVRGEHIIISFMEISNF